MCINFGTTKTARVATNHTGVVPISFAISSSSFSSSNSLALPLGLVSGMSGMSVSLSEGDEAGSRGRWVEGSSWWCGLNCGIEVVWSLVSLFSSEIEIRWTSGERDVDVWRARLAGRRERPGGARWRGWFGVATWSARGAPKACGTVAWVVWGGETVAGVTFGSESDRKPLLGVTLLSGCIEG